MLFFSNSPILPVQAALQFVEDTAWRQFVFLDEWLTVVAHVEGFVISIWVVLLD